MLRYPLFINFPRCIYSLGFLSACSLLSASVLADVVDKSAEKPGSEIVITSTRVAQTRSSTLTPTTVISRQEIEQWQSHTLTDVLQHVQGVTFTNSGGQGQPTSVFLRGTEADHVLVLIDGVAAGSVSSGSMAFQDLPLNQIERIEVVRGPVSSLYGADAVGGVIQIFTIAPDVNKTQQRAKLAVGSYDSFEAALSQQASFQVSESVSGQFNVGVAKTQTQGFNACRSDQGGCFVDEPDEDGYDNRSVNVHFNLQSLAGQKISVSALQANAENQYDGFGTDTADNVQQLLRSEASTPIGEQQQLVLSGGQSVDQSENFAGVVSSSFFDTRRDSVALLHHWQPTEQQRLTSGVDYRYDHLDSDTEFLKTDRQTLGGLLQYQLQWQQYSAQLGGRYDDNSQFGDYSTGNLRLGYQSNPQTQLYASIANAFKAPSFNDLYYPDFSNPDLQPEESVSYELGLEFSGPVQLSTAVFQTDVDQLITYDQALNKPVNLSQARIIGQEFGAQWAIDKDWLFSSQLTVLDAQNRNVGSAYGKALPRRPLRSMTLDVERRWQAWSAGFLLTANSHRYDDLDNTAKLGGYSLLNLRVAQQLSEALQLQASIDNVADKSYETVEYFNQPGRTVWLTLRYQAVQSK